MRASVSRLVKLLLSAVFIFWIVRSLCMSWRSSGSNREGTSRKFKSCQEDGETQILPVILLITPTYSRLSQKADLTRLSYTLLLVPNIHWILVEDSSQPTDLVTNFVTRLTTDVIPYYCRSRDMRVTHLSAETPSEYKPKPKEPHWVKPRGVQQRNHGLSWIRDNWKRMTDVDIESAIVYFVDDDNTYDIKIFEDMRTTKKVSVWPVAMAGELKVERPLVEDGVVVGFNSVWKPERPFPFDMAAFAVRLKYLIENDPPPTFSYSIPVGYQESHLIGQIIPRPEELEPKANNCTEVWVWHTRTEKFKAHGEKKLPYPSDQDVEV